MPEQNVAILGRVAIVDPVDKRVVDDGDVALDPAPDVVRHVDGRATLRNHDPQVRREPPAIRTRTSSDHGDWTQAPRRREIISGGGGEQRRDT